MADYNENIDHDQVTLILDDGQELLCDVIAIFPARDGEYIALLPQLDEEEPPVYLYRFSQGETEDDVKLDNIETDEEFEEVSAAFDEYMDEVDLDEEWDLEDEEQ